MYASPSVRKKQLGSHWTKFHEIWSLIIFLKFVEKNQISLKYDKNNGYLIGRPIFIFYFISFYFSWNEKYCRENCRGNQNTNIMFNYFLFSKIAPYLYEIMWKNTVERDRPQMTIWCMCIVSSETHTHVQNM